MIITPHHVLITVFQSVVPVNASICASENGTAIENFISISSITRNSNIIEPASPQSSKLNLIVSFFLKQQHVPNPQVGLECSA
jgi:hypothetical protein